MTDSVGSDLVGPNAELEGPGLHGARWIGAGLMFLAAWYALDRLGVSPPEPASALTALAAAAAVLIAGQRLLLATPNRRLLTDLGLGRPAGRAMVAAGVVGAGVVATYAVGAGVLDVRLEVRANWPAVLLGALLFHGIAEELVWRGFVFAQLRRRGGFWQAVLLTIPLIALTHTPLIVSDGWLVGGLAVLTAALTCLPLCYLWERGGHTIWAAALLHGLIGMWQVFDRTYPMQFTMVVLIAATVVPLTVFLFGNWFFDSTPASVRTASDRSLRRRR